MKLADLQNNQIARFVLAGVVNTLFGFAVFSVAAFAGAPNWMALLIGMATGMVFNFFTTGGYAFRQLSWRRFPLFAVCHLSVFTVNLALLEWLAPYAHRIFLQFVLAFPMAVMSYFLMSRIAFPAQKG
jgi:putative flippase GtrA